MNLDSVQIQASNDRNKNAKLMELSKNLISLDIDVNSATAFLIAFTHKPLQNV